MPSRYCTHLEVDKTGRYEKKEACYIWNDETLNSYIEQHLDFGCMLAEIFQHPENVVLTGEKTYGHSPFGIWDYKATPISRCRECPFKDCEASEPEMRGFITQNRINNIRRNYGLPKM